MSGILSVCVLGKCDTRWKDIWKSYSRVRAVCGGGLQSPMTQALESDLLPGSWGQVRPITSLHLSPLICKMELRTAPHRAGVRTTFYNVCKMLGLCLDPNKWHMFARYYLRIKDSKPSYGFAKYRSLVLPLP